MGLHSKWDDIYYVCFNTVKILRNKIKHGNPASQKKEIQKYKNIHAGKRCFILGNGPSLKDLDFSLLSDEFVFTVNKLALNPAYPQLNADYHVWTDELFFDMNAEEGSSLLKSFRDLKTEENCPTSFLSYKGKDFAKKFNLASDGKLVFFNNWLKFHDHLPKTIHLEKYTYDFSTVALSAINIAMYMGFKEIYLLGTDCTGIINIVNSRLGQNEMLYAYDVDQESKNRIAQELELRPMENKFKGQYSMFHQYRIISEYCNSKGIKLVNCSSTTILDSIPRANLTSVLSAKE